MDSKHRLGHFNTVVSPITSTKTYHHINLAIEIVLYVDDLLITGSSKDEISSLKDVMNHAFSMTDLGLLSQFLGLKIAQTKHGIKLHQSKYALDLLNKFNMKYCKPSKTPFLSGVKLEEAGSSLW